jgi:hypothetical protein
MERHVNPNPSFITGSVVQANATHEAHKRGSTYTTCGRTVIAAKNMNFVRDIDISWLKAAAASYDISPNIQDYVFVDVPIVTADFPNRNLQAFPYTELSYFDPHYGSMIYQTFRGKPAHIDHQNEDPLKAKGIILDASLQFLPKYNIWKVRIFKGFDRTKDAQLVNDIITRKRRGYSMGALVSAFVCSYCGKIESKIQPCQCMKAGKGSIFDGHLIYSMCADVMYIESSSVSDPADATAWADNLFV